jgi:hypothetical protein
MLRTLVLLIALYVAPAHAQELRCDISTKYVCEVNGCKSVPATGWNVINQAKGTYARCDAKGCDVLDARFSEAGAFLNIQVGPSTIAKMTLIDVPLAELKANSFHEVATQFHAVYVSFGSCKRT